MYRIFFLFFCLSSSARGQAEGESCVDNYTNTIGRCKPIDACESAKRDFQHSPIFVTFCSNNASSVRIVCCRDGSNIQSNNSAGNQDSEQPILKNPVNGHDRKRISEKKCDEYSKSVEIKVSYIPLIPSPDVVSVYEPYCDYTELELIVTAGWWTTTKAGEFPHMAAIGWAGVSGEYLFRCGGSLISPRFVVTAAHCQRLTEALTPEPVIVRLGDQNLDNNVRDGADPVDVAIRRLHIHPDYASPKLYNDIALLELVADVKFRNGIRPACLWTNRDFDGHKNVIATGWGLLNHATKETAKELQKEALPILDVDYCNRTLKSSIFRNWMYGFSDSQMCAGGKDTCQGDSGSPIQLASKENHCIFHIVGITSFGKKCAEKERPVVYTRVSSFVDWIESVVWPGQ